MEPGTAGATGDGTDIGRALAERITVHRVIQDCANCPELVIVPPGRFVLGSADDEAFRDADEGPALVVTFTNAFAIGQTEVTRGQFAAFISATGYAAAGQCLSWTGTRLELVVGRSWRDPGYAQTDGHPVACVTWRDAAAFVTWLRKTTGKAYRLPSNAEWEYAARGGTQAAHAFAGGEDDACRFGNVADVSAKQDVAQWRTAACDDATGLGTARVRSYAPNGYGIYDTVGNVWEWIADCYQPTYLGAPIDGSAWGSAGECGAAFDRGGGFSNLMPGHLRAANRSRAPSPDTAAYSLGFRVARDLAAGEFAQGQ